MNKKKPADKEALLLLYTRKSSLKSGAIRNISVIT